MDFLLIVVAMLCFVFSLLEWNKCRKDPLNQSTKPAIYLVVGIILLVVSC